MHLEKHVKNTSDPVFLSKKYFKRSLETNDISKIHAKGSLFNQLSNKNIQNIEHSQAT